MLCPSFSLVDGTGDVGAKVNPFELEVEVEEGASRGREEGGGGVEAGDEGGEGQGERR